MADENTSLTEPFAFVALEHILGIVWCVRMKLGSRRMDVNQDL